jgi:hypothetical protein
MTCVSQQCPFVGNRRWAVGKVVCVPVNVQGSCNDLCDVQPNPAWHAARNVANIAWMREAFAVAERRNVPVVMIISQADPGFNAYIWDVPNRDSVTLAEARDADWPDGARIGEGDEPYPRH